MLFSSDQQQQGGPRWSVNRGGLFPFTPMHQRRHGWLLSEPGATGTRAGLSRRCPVRAGRTGACPAWPVRGVPESAPRPDRESRDSFQGQR